MLKSPKFIVCFDYDGSTISRLNTHRPQNPIFILPHHADYFILIIQ